MRGVVGAVAAVVLVLAGGALVFVENVASPDPATTLSRARAFTARQRTASYRVELVVGTAAQGGKLVQQANATGVTIFGGGSDFRLEHGAAAEQYILIPGAGAFVREAPTDSRLLSRTWAHARSLEVLETAVGGPDAALDDTVIAALSDGQIVGRIMESASRPSRVGSSARQLAVGLDPNVVFGPGLGVTLTATITTDSASHLRGITIHAATQTGTIDAVYTLSFDAPAVVSPPPQADVVAEL